MILSIEELSKIKKIYVSYESISLGAFTYAVYNVNKYEYRGVNKHYVKLKTLSQNKLFQKEINLVGMNLSMNPYQFSDNIDDLKKSFCKKLKKTPEKNPKLLKKLTEDYPHYFI